MKRVLLPVILLTIFSFTARLTFAQQHTLILSKEKADSVYYTDLVSIAGVTITGTKSETRNIDVPAAITSISASKIEQERITNLTLLTSQIPNLFMPDYGSRLTSPVYIRGIGSRINAPAIGLYVDEVAQFEKAAFNFDLFNIKRIEVLRGPQGTLYGRNTMGGIIHVLTNDPRSERHTHFAADLGSYGTGSLRFSHDQPLIQNQLGIQLAGIYRQRNGYHLNAFNNEMVDRQRSGAASFKVKWSATDRLSVNFSLNTDISREGGYPYGIVSVNDDQVTMNPINYDHYSSYSRDILGSSLRVSYRFPGMTFSSISGYQFMSDLQDIDQDFTPRDLFKVTQDQDQAVLTQEFQLKSTGDKRIEWITGIYAFGQDIYREVDVFYSAEAVPLYRLPGMLSRIKTYDMLNTGTALFGQVKVKDLLIKRLDLILGARLDQETDRLDYTHFTRMNGNDIPADAFDHSYSFLEFLPKAALQYRISDLASTYFSLTKGYNAGGFNTTIERPEDETYGPEFSWNYEYGFKAQSRNGRYSLAGALFYIDWKDQQIYQPVPSGQGSMLKNVGESLSRGFEIEATASPVKNLAASFSLGYTEARFADYVRDSVKNIDYSGNFIPYVPLYTYHTGATYRIPLYHKVVDEIRLSLTWQGTGRIYWDDTNTLTQDPYGLLSARIEYLFKSFTFALWARNLLNQNYFAFQFSALGSHYAQPGVPRILGATLSARF